MKDSRNLKLESNQSGKVEKVMDLTKKWMKILKLSRFGITSRPAPTSELGVVLGVYNHNITLDSDRRRCFADFFKIRCWNPKLKVGTSWNFNKDRGFFLPNSCTSKSGWGGYRT